VLSCRILCLYTCLGSPARSRLSHSAVALTDLFCLEQKQNKSERNGERGECYGFDRFRPFSCDLRQLSLKMFGFGRSESHVKGMVNMH